MKYGDAAGRRGIIMERLQAQGFVTTADLAQDTAVSEMTVRRDLQLLQEQGALLLVRGGAALPMASRLASFDARQMVNIEAKQRIAQLAAGWVGAADTVALDAGTTAYALAVALPSAFAGCVVTSSVPAMQMLMDRAGPRVIALGGELHHASRACIGPMAVEGASRLRVRTFFLGAAAVDRRGVYVSADLERPTKLALMEIADRVVLLADHSKFGQSAPVLLCPLSRVQVLITDAPPPPDMAAALRRNAVQMEVAR